MARLIKSLVFLTMVIAIIVLITTNSTAETDTDPTNKTKNVAGGHGLKVVEINTIKNSKDTSISWIEIASLACALAILIAALSCCVRHITTCVTYSLATRLPDVIPANDINLAPSTTTDTSNAAATPGSAPTPPSRQVMPIIPTARPAPLGI